MSVQSRNRIYLSYNNLDAVFSLHLAEDLITAGIDLWFDRYEIHPEDDPSGITSNIINQCAAAVIVLSADYITAPYCLAEFQQLSDSSIPLIFVQIEAITNDSTWQGELARFQPIDMTGWRDQAIYEAAFQTVYKRIAEQVPDATGIHATEEKLHLLRTITDIELELVSGLFGQVATFNQEGTGAATFNARPRTNVAHTWITRGSYSFPEVQAETSTDSVYARYEIAVENIYELLASYPQIALVGDGGSGKTLTLLYLALMLAHNRLRDGRNHPIPLLVTFASWRQNQGVETFIKGSWTLESDIIELLMRGDVMLLADGLNEMDQPGDNRLDLLRRWLQGQTAPARAAIACRTEPYYEQLQLPLPVVRLEEISAELAGTIAAQLLAPSRRDSFITRIPEISALLKTAFGLSAALFVQDSYEPEALPRNEGQLLKQFLQALWERVDKDMIGRFTLDDIREGLTRLAFAMYEQGYSLYITRKYALEQTGDDLLLQTADYVNLLQVHGQRIRFRHSDMQQFFAARGLVSEGVHARMMYPVFDENGMRQPQPYDPLLMIAPEVADRPQLTIETMSQIDPYAAASAIGRGIPISGKMQQDIVRRLLDSRQRNYRSQAATQHAFAEIGHTEQTINALVDMLRAEDRTVRQSASDALPLALRDVDNTALQMLDPVNLESGPHTLPYLVSLLESEDQAVRHKAIWALGEMGDKAGVIALENVLEGDEPALIASALQALGKIGDNAALKAIMQRVFDPDHAISDAALEALSKMQRPGTRGLLDILHEEDRSTQQAVIEAVEPMSDALVTVGLLKIAKASREELKVAAKGVMRDRKDADKVKRFIKVLSDKVDNLRDREAFSALTGELKRNAATATRKQGTARDVDTLAQRIRAGNAEIRPGAQSPAAEGTTTKEDALHHENWLVRYEAVKNLRGKDPADALPVLLEAVHDSESEIRIAAIEGLTQFSDDSKAINALLLALADNEPLVIDAASDALRSIGKPAVLGLTEMLRSGNVQTRAAAIETLGAISDPIAVREIVPFINDTERPWLDDRTIGEIAVQALIDIGTPEAKEAIKTRWRSVEVEGMIPPGIDGDDNNTPVTTHQDSPEALLTMPEFPPAASEEVTQEVVTDELAVLLDELYSDDWDTSQEAGKALREYARARRDAHDTQLLQRLLPLLDEDEWTIRLAGVESIAWLQDESAFNDVARLLNDENWMVRISAIRSLAEINAPYSADSVIPMLDDDNSAVREVAAEVLGIFRTQDALTRLALAINDEEPLVRLAVLKAIRAYGKEANVYGLLLRGLEDSYTHVRWVAVQSLRDLRDERAIPHLIPLLEDESRPRWEKKRVCDIVADALRVMPTAEGQVALQQWKKRQRKQD